MLNIKDGLIRNDGDHGFFSGIFNEDYHSSDEVSSSKLQTLIDCPGKYDDVRSPSTPSQEFGSAFHAILLEPDIFAAQYHILENSNKRTNKYKEEVAEASKMGKSSFLTQTEYDNLCNMVRAAKKHPQFKPLFSGGHAEVSVYSSIDGVNVKCRPDYMFVAPDGAIIIVDVKTSLSCMKSDLELSISKYAYHRQAAFYIDTVKSVLGEDRRVFFANYFVESTRTRKPENGNMDNHISVVSAYIPPEDIEQGRREYKNAIENYKKLRNNEDFSCDGLFSDVIFMGLKGYKKDEFNRSTIGEVI